MPSLGKTVELAVHGIDKRKHLANLIENSESVFKHHLLRQIANSDARRHSHATAARALKPGNNLQHGTLAGTILAHKGYLVLGVYHIVYIVEKELRTELHRDKLLIEIMQ